MPHRPPVVAPRDPIAFTALYRRYVTPIYRYAYSRMGNRADAEDIAAQVFSEALAGLDRYREEGNFAAWLFTIAARRIVDHYRQAKPHLPLDAAYFLSADGRSPLNQAIHNENMAELARLVNQWPQRQQLSIMFADALGFSSFSEYLDPKQLIQVVNPYLTVAARAITQHEGMIDKFMGDAVNLAKRLQEISKPGQILLSAAVYDQVQGWADVEEMPPVQVKGRQALEQTYLLIGDKTAVL
jgi:RNA polymerase sigma-70 factor (ECF subfamily)